MDYALYNINLLSGGFGFEIDTALYEQMLFSTRIHNDSWYKDIFRQHLNQKLLAFLKFRWMLHCAEQGQTTVWLCLVGFPVDSHEPDFRRVSCIWAVDSKTGMPVSWQGYPQGNSFAGAVAEMMAILDWAHVRVEGVIIGHDFALPSNVRLCKEAFGLEYMVYLPRTAAGYRTMMERYAAKIQGKAQYALKSSNSAIFGTVEQVPLFVASEAEPYKAYVGLFFGEELRGKAGRLFFAHDVLFEAKDLNRLLVVNPSEAEVPAQYKLYLHIGRDEDTFAQRVFVDHEALQRDIEEAGFIALASSAPYAADELYQLYNMRQAEETLFAQFAKMLECGDIREVYGLDEETVADFHYKLFCTFIGAVLHTDIEQTCTRHGCKFDLVWRDFNRLQLRLAPAELTYHPFFYQELVQQILPIVGDYGFTPELFSCWRKRRLHCATRGSSLHIASCQQVLSRPQQLLTKMLL